MLFVGIVDEGGGRFVGVGGAFIVLGKMAIVLVVGVVACAAPCGVEVGVDWVPKLKVSANTEAASPKVEFWQYPKTKHIPKNISFLLIISDIIFHNCWSLSALNRNITEFPLLSHIFHIISNFLFYIIFILL